MFASDSRSSASGNSRTYERREKGRRPDRPPSEGAGRRERTRSGLALEVVVAHGAAHLDAVLGEVALAALLLHLLVLGVVAPGGEVLEGVELDDGDVLSILGSEVLVGDEPRHR